MVTLRLIGIVLSAAVVLAQVPTTSPFSQAYGDALQLRTLVKGGSVVPNWLDDHRFWFEDVTVARPNVFLVDPAANTKTPYTVPESSRAIASRSPGINSTDAKMTAFLKNGNVWLEATDAPAHAVTTDGTEDHFYGSLTSRSDALMWSGDGRYILLQKIDTHGIRRYPVLTFFDRGKPDLPHEEVSFEKLLPRVGEKLPTATLSILEVSSGRSTPVEMQATDSTLRFLSWPRGSKEVFILETTREAKRMNIYGVDGETGKCRLVLNETSATFLMTPQGRNEYLFAMLPDGKRFLWGSERDGWRHLYLYGVDGALKRRLTEGRFPVVRIVTIDGTGGWVYFTAHAESRIYDTHLYRVDFDGTGFQRLTESNGTHVVTFSPDKHYFIDNWSSIDTPPISELRRADGHLLRVLSRSSLEEAVRRGWSAPEEFTTLAADDKTELHGVLYKPWNLNQHQRYPVVDMIYAGPLVTWVPHSFFGEPRGANPVQAQALAQLGFVVMILDARGTPERSKAFQDTVYGSVGVAEIPDHVAALHQLAAQRSYIDTKRVGVIGHSWGGYFALRAMFTEPDVFKVGLAESPVVDLWVEAPDVEPYMGLPEQNPLGYERGSNISLAKNLKGKLLIIHGTSDAGAPLSGTMRLIYALERAGRPYDLILLVHEGHNDVATSSYAQERLAKYLIEHLRP
jgi:dipeptidyl aminopeptidase/acylaminoacyl peptidase